MNFQGITLHPVVLQQAISSHFPHRRAEHFERRAAGPSTDKALVLAAEFPARRNPGAFGILEGFDGAELEVLDLRQKGTDPLDEGVAALDVDAAGSNDEVFGDEPGGRLRVACLPDLAPEAFDNFNGRVGWNGCAPLPGNIRWRGCSSFSI